MVVPQSNHGLPSVTSIAPTRPDPTFPLLPSTPSNSVETVSPDGSGGKLEFLGFSDQAFTASSVNNLTCSGQVLYGCDDTIFRAVLVAHADIFSSVMMRRRISVC